MSRAPDFILKALNKVTDERSGKLGCAWMNENGSLTLALDMCVTLAANPDMVLTLFPNDDSCRRPAPNPAHVKSAPVKRVKSNTMAALPVTTTHRL